mgnify:CR=1 FL=1
MKKIHALEKLTFGNFIKIATMHIFVIDVQYISINNRTNANNFLL